MKQVFAIHTGPVLVEVLKPLFAELLPEVRLVNLMDDGLLTDTRARGGVDAALCRRLVNHGLTAADAGADAILNCCSSLGEAADLLASLVSIPVVKIDDRMATQAVALGPRIAVVGTVAATLAPTERMIRRKAAAEQRDTHVSIHLVEGAFDALLSGNAALHDELLQRTIAECRENYDVVVLAQGSMARLVPLVEHLHTTPLLSSPRLGLLALRDALFGAGAAAPGALAPERSDAEARRA